MAFDEKLASRVRDVFAGMAIPAEEKRMMGGKFFHGERQILRRYRREPVKGPP